MGTMTFWYNQAITQYMKQDSRKSWDLPHHIASTLERSLAIWYQQNLGTRLKFSLVQG